MLPDEASDRPNGFPNETQPDAPVPDYRTRRIDTEDSQEQPPDEPQRSDFATRRLEPDEPITSPPASPVPEAFATQRIDPDQLFAALAPEPEADLPLPDPTSRHRRAAATAESRAVFPAGCSHANRSASAARIRCPADGNAASTIPAASLHAAGLHTTFDQLHTAADPGSANRDRPAGRRRAEKEQHRPVYRYWLRGRRAAVLPVPVRRSGGFDDRVQLGERFHVLNLLIAPDSQRAGKSRLRSAWRIAGQTALLLFFSVLLALPLGILQGIGAIDGPMIRLAAQAAGMAGMVASVAAARWLFDRRSMGSLGLERKAQSAPDLVAGFLIAGGMMAAIFGLLWAAGWLAVERVAPATANTAGALLQMLGAFIAVGFVEELYVRGYLFQNLADGLNAGWALAISSLVFALGHLANPHINGLAIAGLTLAGVFLAAAYLLTRQLWLPIGLHIGWNFFEGAIFGFPVSGLGGFHWIEARVSGPALITGGEFGPEAGLILLPALLIGLWLIYRWGRRSGSPA